MKNNSTLELMKVRVDNWSDLYSLEHTVPSSAISGVEGMANRLQSAGGTTQQARMIRDKKKALDRALLFSYQGANVKKCNEDKIFRALINPSRLSQDYDIKTISADFKSELAAGDVVEWLGTKSFWLVYLQDLTELAYFRADIRKCAYEIKWQIDGVNKSTYAAVKGPTETTLNTIQKHNIVMDVPNYTLSLLVPKNEETLEYFKRYTKFFLNGDDEKRCWRVEATDSISTPGIIEVYASEYYINLTEDDVENGIIGGLIEPVENPNEEIIEELIIGETFIKPKITYQYTFNGENAGVWTLNDSKLPIALVVVDNNNVKIKWTASYSGQFDLSCGDYTKTIVVESLF